MGLKNNRRNFGRTEKGLPELDLSKVQRESWQWFLIEGIAQELIGISPIDDFTGKNWQLVLGEHSLGEPTISPSLAQEKGLTYSCPLKIIATLINKRTGKEITQEVFLGDLPQMTLRGTFIINGIERAVINQIVRSPGVYFSEELDVPSGRMLGKAEVRPLHGSWLEFEVSRGDVISARIDRRKKVLGTVFLRAMGLSSDEEIISALEGVDKDTVHQYIQATLAKDPTKSKEEAVLEIYRKLRPGEPAVLENAEALFQSLFLEHRRYDLGKVGRYKINKRLNLNLPNEKSTWVLTRQDIVAAISYLISLQNGLGRVDDIDHLANRRLRRVGELVAVNAFRVGLLRLERSIKEKMSLVSPEDKPLPATLINARPLIASLNEFFRSNQLSTILDDTNPLSEIDNLRRVSVLGPGGINRERASFSIRDVNSSQYGRLDPVRSPEGPNIGLVTYLALYARVNEFGFLETPYRKVEKIKKGKETLVKVTDEIVYLTADDEADRYITYSGIKISGDGYIEDERLPLRYNGNFSEGPVALVDFVDVTPRQVIGASASLIPFLAHDEGNRSLMGSNMQCQSVPLVNPESPVVGTGMEKEIAKGMSRVVYARHSGVVEYADAKTVEVKLDKKADIATSKADEIEITDDGKKETYHLMKFKRTAHSTCYNQKVVICPGDRVREGDLIADGPSIESGELSLGRNLVIAYTSMSGYGFEDAILVSDKIVKDDLLTSIHIEEHEADVVDTKLGPEELTRDIPNVAESELANLAEDGIVVVGAEVGPNDILVGKIAPKGETELTSEERLLRAIFGEKAREVRDTSLRVPHGEKGIVVSVSILDKDRGDELGPGVIKKVVVKVAQTRKLTVGDKVAGRHGNKGVVAKIMPVSDMPYLPDGTPVDIIISPLSVLARMNLGQLLECHLGWALSKKDEKGALPVFDRVSEDLIFKELESANLPISGKIKLRDGRTGEEFKEETVVGIAYIMKLIHMVEDKTHARSTGPYSLVTQQPLGGKAQMGGQRLGEMEVWALEAHRAAYTLQEMLTIKSDDIIGRAKAFEAIVKGVDIPEATVPESFKVLVRELNSLGLSIEPKGAIVLPETEVVAEIEEKNMNTIQDIDDLRKLADFTSLVIRLASPEDIRRWSRGEVLKPETINYRTLKPEKDGLFDERIFGPTKDWECYCGKYKRIRYKGVVCDKCGVEVTQSRVRRERMGHISLATPIAHVWFFKGAPSRLSLLLGVPPRGIEQVIYFARYLVVDVKEEGRKEAIKALEKARQVREKEIAETFREAKENLAKEAQKEKEKVESKIKDKEQLALAVSEVELELRKKKTSLSEEEGKTMEKTGQLFENLISLAKGVKPLTILSEDEHEELIDHEVGDFLTVKMGADAVLLAIDKLNIDETSAQLAKELEESKVGSSKYIKVSKRLKLINGLRRAKINPSSMVLRVLPVLPPDLRPMVQLSGGRFATSDLNDLYRRVINRNNRLKHLIGLGAPEIILRNEKRMLQEAVDSLIDASQRKATRKGRGKQPLRSLSDMLRGKQGRFRQNLLGKRVDYSGRSVIVVGPELKLTQCGLPKEMALEMFKPFVLREMIIRGIAPNVKSAKNMLDRRPAEVFDILEEIIKDHPVLLNRAPTLHKLSIQAFYPVLIEGNAIRLHPAVCSGFNADFDGDQMAVHVPLSKRAIEEAKILMLPTSNLLKPSDGSPATTPATKEIALGIYFLTSIDINIKASDSLFGDKNEAIFAYQSEKIELKQLITVKTENGFVDTTCGRILFNEALPSGFDFVNEAVTSVVIKQLLTKAFNTHTGEEVAEMIDAIKDLGFWAGTVSGLSFGISDAKILPRKAAMLEEAEKEVSKIEENFAQGLITVEEKRRLAQEVWINVTEELVDKTWDALDEDNPIKIVINAKVGRTSKDQVKQLAAMRGLIVDPVGKIVELPIKSNFREGLSEFEYVTSSRGSRKGLTDTAIKTADAGYLTRRLVDVAHDVIVRDEDCGTKEKYVVRRNPRANVFYSRILGRYLAEDIAGAKRKPMFKKGDLLDELKAKEVDANSNITEVSVRSPLTCGLRHGMCVKCYGWDFSNRKVVVPGTPVGVIAAESIGEPGTQLTLRTKHTGGVVGVDVTQGLPRVEELFEARTPKVLSPLSEISGKLKISETNEGWKVVISSKEAKLKDERQYLIPKSIKLAISDGDFIESGSALAAGSLDIKEILLIKGLLTAQEYIVSEIQKVYESQGIPINDKHFEVIVRKMSDDVKVATSGDTAFLPGEIINKAGFEEENEKILAAGGEPASAQQVILGITRRALFVESWLSAASFEQTTDILTEASLLGKEDRLLGLKENVIIGRLVPVLPERFI